MLVIDLDTTEARRAYRDHDLDFPTARAWDLHLQGLSEETIRRELGVPRDAVPELVREAWTRYGESTDHRTLSVTSTL